MQRKCLKPCLNIFILFQSVMSPKVNLKSDFILIAYDIRSTKCFGEAFLEHLIYEKSQFKNHERVKLKHLYCFSLLFFCYNYYS